MQNANDILIVELEALNQRILQAEETGLKDEIAPLLHKDFTIIRATGVKQDRPSFLDAVSNNAHRGRITEQAEVRLYGDCAVFTCVVMTTQNPDGSTIAGRFGTRGCLSVSSVSGDVLPGRQPKLINLRRSWR